MKPIKKEKRITRHKRVRALVRGSKERPRLSVFRSNKHVFLQLIDDDKEKTIAGVSDKEVLRKKGMTKSDASYEAGKMLAEKAKKLGVTAAVFDRGGYVYQGRVKKVAEGARAGGLQF